MQQAVARHVGDVLVRAQREGRRIVALEPRAHAAVEDRVRDLFTAPCAAHEFNGVDDLDVAGTAAQVRVDGLRNVVACRRGVLVEEPLGPQRDAGDAEPALSARRDRERTGECLALGRRYPFERQDLGAVGLFGRHGARGLRLAVDERQARAALALRGAAVVDRRDVAIVAKDVEERLAGRDIGALGDSVEDEANRPHRCSIFRRRSPQGRRRMDVRGGTEWATADHRPNICQLNLTLCK